MRQMQIRDKRPHQPRLTDTRRERKAERRKIPLEVRNRRKLFRMASSSSLLQESFLGGAISVIRCSISSE